MNTLLDVVIDKHGTHQKTADAVGVSRPQVSFYNLVKDNDQRNEIGLRYLLKSEAEFKETVVSDGYLLTVEKRKL